MNEGICVLYVDSGSEARHRAEAITERSDTIATEEGTYISERQYTDPITVRIEPTQEAALAALESATIDCVLTEYTLAEGDGLTLLREIRHRKPALPVILLTDSGSEAIASEAIGAGSTDYCLKQPPEAADAIAELTDRIHRAVTRYWAARDQSLTTSQFRAVAETSTDAVFTLNGRTITYANPAFEHIFGYEPSTIIGDPIEKLLPERFRDRYLDALERYMYRDSEQIERSDLTIPGLHADGHELDCHIALVALEDESDGAFTGIVRDLTDTSDIRTWYRTLIRHSSDIIAVLDEEGAIRYQSPAIERVLGYDGTTLLGQNAFELIHSEDRPDALEAFGSIRNQERASETGQFRFKAADGSWHWLETIVSDRADSVLEGYVINARDITERIKARAKREEALARMTDGMLSLDDQWRFTYLNSRAEELLGVTDAVLGETLWDVFPELAGTAFETSYRGSMATGEPISIEEYYAPMGAWFAVHTYPSESGMSIYLRDITEQKRIERELQANEAALRALQNITADPDREFEQKLADVLELGCDRLGLSLGFLTEIDTDDSRQTIVTVAGDHELLQAGASCPLSKAYCRRTIEQPGLLSVREAGKHPDWERDQAYESFGLETYIGGKIVVNGDLYGTVCFAGTKPRSRPFTESELAFTELLVEWMSYELESQHREHELERQNERLELFASVVSHDVRNPLSVAMGHLEMAKETGDPAHFEDIEYAHNRIKQLIDDLLMLAREGQDIGETEVVALATVIESAWSTVETEAATLESAVEATSCLEADVDRLRQLLENLFRNAIEHGGTDVTITVELCHDERKTRFAIEDDGPGIPPDKREQVRKSGYSTADEGTGIGLAIVERIVHAHGWELAITDGETGGARFEITGIRPV